MGTVGEDGPRCFSCGGDGHHAIRGCPVDQITPDVWEFVRLANWADNGKILPEGGGVHDQTRSFMDALAVWRNEQAAIENAKIEAMKRIR